MPVITLTMSWHTYEALPSRQPVWRFEVCGRNLDIDMSSHKFIRGRVAPFPTMEKSYACKGTGPVAWLLTPDQEPMLGRASFDNPPMGLVTCFLEDLEDKGYHVITSNSISGGPGQSFSASCIWTLKKNAPQKQAASSQLTA